MEIVYLSGLSLPEKTVVRITVMRFGQCEKNDYQYPKMDVRTAKLIALYDWMKSRHGPDVKRYFIIGDELESEVKELITGKTQHISRKRKIYWEKILEWMSCCKWIPGIDGRGGLSNILHNELEEDERRNKSYE